MVPSHPLLSCESSVSVEKTLIQKKMYLHGNNFYGWVMSQKIPINGFKWVGKSKLSRFNERFIKNYSDNSDMGYFLEVDIDYPK